MSILSPGRYVQIKGVDYLVVTRGDKWAASASEPTPGFTIKSGRTHLRIIEPGEKLKCVDISHEGTYRRIPVQVEPSNKGRLMVTTKDDRARSEGFDPFDRDEWVKIIPEGDRELRFVTKRTPTPSPWLIRGGFGGL